MKRLGNPAPSRGGKSCSKNLLFCYSHHKRIKYLKRCGIIFTILLAVFFSLALIFNASIDLAQASWLDEQTGFGIGGDIPKSFGETGAPSDVRVITAKVVRVFLGILGVIFVILIILAGYKWMTAGGNEDKVKEARDQMIRAAIGMAIIMAAWGITTFVMNCVFEAATNQVFNWYCP